MTDAQSYNQIPEEDQWVFNKMEICRRFGHKPFGPCGVSPPIGTYCIRPIMDLAGMASGGFWKCILNKNKILIPKNMNKPGYFWSPWENGARRIFEYVENRLVAAQIAISFDEKTNIEHYRELPPNKAPALPEQLQGISRYMRVEYLGNIIIDIGVRHQYEESLQSVIQDYRKFDPNYTPPEDVVFGFQPFMKRIQDSRTGGYRWESITTTIQRKIYR